MSDDTSTAGETGVDPQSPSAARPDLVTFRLEVEGSADSWGVERVTLEEALNSVPRCEIEARYRGHTDERELLHKAAALSIERSAGQHTRYFKGIVWHARVEPAMDDDELVVYLQVTPAMALLGCIQDSRIFQDVTVAGVIHEVFRRALSERERSVVVDDLQRTYERREYVVQYDESTLGFVVRLCEEEGIYFYFDHETEPETVRLADAVGGLPRARVNDGGEVRFCEHPEQLSDGEAVSTFRHRFEVGPTDVVVSDHDWTHPTLDIRGSQTGLGRHGSPALETFDHTDALVFHSFDGVRYEGHTAAVQARLRRERQDLARQFWEATSTVVTAWPGTTLSITGCPEAEHDQRYLVVGSSALGTATAGTSGTFEASLQLVPTTMEYRPARRTARPIAHGPEIATVVGPSGQEIHTDLHGRVRVHFPWDRHHARDAETSSCWMRVSHNWAGPGFGTFFLPRIGMEVLVSFLGGNPDRPLVTGCVYNGANRVGVELDAKKTQSLIRTKSSPDSEGFNELRFEDDAGNEFIFVHAQKDYNEVVEHCHSTHVKVDQSNTVDHDHTETVGHDQKLTVKGMREKTVENSETVEIQADRTETVFGNEDLTLKSDRITKITHNETIEIGGDRTIKVKGREDQLVVQGREVVIEGDDVLRVSGGANRTEEFTGERTVSITNKFDLVQGDSEKLRMDGQKTYLESAKEVTVKTGSSEYVLKSDGNVKLTAATKVEIEVGGCKIEMTPQKITLTAGPSSIELGPSGVTTSGPKITSSAQTMNEITGLLVKLN
ncbi:MAG: type VI secretion system tip protein VgrG [Sandaracinaceae bacterium]|nr:type VI secretion system tip protein VgrG [Sandaracinaceae bacterium]